MGAHTSALVPLGGRVQPWQKRAACKGEPPELFTGEDIDNDKWPSLKVKSICDQCPVRTQCLDDALANNAWGIWGGTTRKQREALKRPHVRSKCPDCGEKMSRDTEDDESQICPSCGMSWRTARRKEE